MPDHPAPTIRDATRADLDALLAIEAQFPGDRLSRRQLRHHVENPRARLRAAVSDGKVVGYHLVLMRTGSRRARLYSIAVDAAARGRGAGARLLADAERESRAAGCDFLQLEVRVDNGAALALYASSGYERFGEYGNYYADGAAAVRLLKRLQPPPRP